MTDDPMLDRVLRQARSHGDFQDRPVSEELLRAAHEQASRDKLRPALSAINWYNKPGVAEVNAFRNSSLQGAYLIIALRAVGLDCGAMSGFDNARLDAAFFPDGRLKSNFLINIGYGTGKGIPPRNPRFSFEEQCRFL